jgi:hypothetical protein
MICPELADPAPPPAPLADWSRGTELQAANEAAKAAIVRVLAMRELI